MSESLREYLSRISESDSLVKSLVEQRMTELRTPRPRQPLGQEELERIARSAVAYIQSQPELNSYVEREFGPGWASAVK
jgi:hypothetical protein